MTNMKFENLEQFKEWFKKDILPTLDFDYLVNRLAKNNAISLTNFLSTANTDDKNSFIKNTASIFLENGTTLLPSIYHLDRRWAAILYIDSFFNLRLDFYEVNLPYEEFLDVIIYTFMKDKKYTREDEKEVSDYYLNLYEKYKKENLQNES